MKDEFQVLKYDSRLRWPMAYISDPTLEDKKFFNQYLLSLSP